MSWVDIGIIALVVLLGLLGVLKGFKKSLVSLGAFLVSFILAFFLANVIAEALLGLEGVKGFVLGNGFGEGSDFSLAKMIYGLMGKNGYTASEESFLFKNYTMPIWEIIAQSKVVINDFNQGYALYLAFIMFSAICGVGIFMVVRFLLVIVTAIIKTYIDKKKSPLSRLGGFVIGAIRGGLWAFAITLVFSCFGGMTFMPGMHYVEDEYEHKNAVFCQYFNIGAYYIRNHLFLPNADTYGRMVEMVFKKGSDENYPDKMTDEQAKLFVNISNLNFEGEPWSWNGETHTYVLDGENAKAYDVESFADVGFDKVMKSIFDYNESAAELILSCTLTDEQIKTYNSIAYTSANSIAKKLNSLVDALREYNENYKHGKTLTDNTAISNWNNVTLSENYRAIKDLIDELVTQYSNMPNLGEFPDIKADIPERVNAGPQATPKPEEGEEESEDNQSVSSLEAMLLRKAAII